MNALFLRNKLHLVGVYCCVFMAHRWFPSLLALFQTVRHLALIGYDYWSTTQNEKHFDVIQFIRRDLALPLFDPYPFCGAYSHFSFGQSAVIGFDFPAFICATFLHAIVNWRAASSCVEVLTTPRGQFIVAVFIPILWYMVGLNICRLVQGHWRREASGRFSRAILSIGLIPLPFGVLCLLLCPLLLFVSSVGETVRVAGLAFWAISVAALSAERLRLGPFQLVGNSNEFADSTFKSRFDSMRR